VRRTDSQSLTLAAGAAGILAVAAAIQIGTAIELKPSRNQLPGYARTIGLDPTADVLRLGILCALPLLVGIAIARLPTRLPSHRTRLALSVFIITASGAAGYGLPAGLAVGAAAAVAAVSFRTFFASLVREDRLGLALAVATAILGWTFLAEPLARFGWTPLQTGPLLLLLVLAEAFLIGRGDLERGATNFALSVVALPVALFGSRSESISWIAGVAALALPVIPAFAMGRSPRRDRILRRIARYVLLPGVIVALAATVCLRVPPVADIFEDGHGLLPAAEYLRGEIPYRDVVPGHGVLSDGGIQAASLRIFGDDYVGLRRGMKVVGASFWPSIYFAGFAATGSAAVGFWTLLLSFLWFPQYMFLRVIASLGVLALACAAARTGRRPLWFAAGAGLPAAVLLSVDFASYAAAGCLVAIVVSRGLPGSGAARVASGLLFGAALIAVPFALAGALPAFLRTTFVDLHRLLPVYALGFHSGFGEIRGWLSDWSFLSDRESFFGCALISSAVAVAILAARFPGLGVRGRALAPVIAWMFAATISVVERRHVGYPAFVLPLLVVLAARWIVGHSGWGSLRGVLAATLLGAFLVCARPSSLAASLADGLQTGRTPAGVTELATLPRARGALFTGPQRAVVLRADEYLRSRRFGASDTWLDFSNTPGLYYLLNRNCPIRYYEVPFFEDDSAQREVIAAVRANHHVRSVLVGTGLWFNAIDGISNFDRAPRVAEFIRREFHPAYSKDGVEFWERNPVSGR
jgi:hypothetical protein